MTTKHSARRRAARKGTPTEDVTEATHGAPKHHEESFFTGTGFKPGPASPPPGAGTGGADTNKPPHDPAETVVTMTYKQFIGALMRARHIGSTFGQISGIRATREQAMAIIGNQDRRLVRAGRKVALLRQALYAQQRAGALAMDALDQG